MMEGIEVAGILFSLMGVIIGSVSKRDGSLIMGSMFVCTGMLVVSMAAIASKFIAGG